MKIRVKNLWTKALRSGKYKQGKGRLRNAKNQFCCLGVLCDLYIKVKKHKAQWSRHIDMSKYTLNGDGGLLPDAVMEWSGVSNATLITIDGKNSSLFHHNDKGLKFKKIAQAIEEQL